VASIISGRGGKENPRSLSRERTIGDLHPVGICWKKSRSPARLYGWGGGERRKAKCNTDWRGGKESNAPSLWFFVSMDAKIAASPAPRTSKKRGGRLDGARRKCETTCPRTCRGESALAFPGREEKEGYISLQKREGRLFAEERLLLGRHHQSSKNHLKGKHHIYKRCAGGGREPFVRAIAEKGKNRNLPFSSGAFTEKSHPYSHRESMASKQIHPASRRKGRGKRRIETVVPLTRRKKKKKLDKSL